MVRAWYYNLSFPICPVVLSEFEKMWKYSEYSFFHPGFVTLTEGKDSPFRGKIETEVVSFLCKMIISVLTKKTAPVFKIALCYAN